MQIEEKSVVIITVPRIVVPARLASEYLQMANKFYNDVKNTLLEDLDRRQLTYDNRYCSGNFIPTIKETNSYTDILRSYVDVEQVDKYIKFDDKDTNYISNEQVEEMWILENGGQEDDE